MPPRGGFLWFLRNHSPWVRYFTVRARSSNLRIPEGISSLNENAMAENSRSAPQAGLNQRFLGFDVWFKSVLFYHLQQRFSTFRISEFLSCPRFLPVDRESDSSSLRSSGMTGKNVLRNGRGSGAQEYRERVFTDERGQEPREEGRKRKPEPGIRLRFGIIRELVFFFNGISPPFFSEYRHSRSFPTADPDPHGRNGRSWPFARRWAVLNPAV